jgi:hypothetical protein
MNGANGMSDIEGKAARAVASERGQRASFNTKCIAAESDDGDQKNKKEKLKRTSEEAQPTPPPLQW